MMWLRMGFALSMAMGGALLVPTAAQAALYGTPRPKTVCTADGACHAVFDRQDKAAARLCGASSASIAWRKGTSNSLIQCADSSVNEENVNYLVMQNGKSVVALDYGRYVENVGSAVDRLPPMSGAATTLPLCSPVDAAKRAHSNFILLSRKARDSDSYCYAPTYLIVDDDDVSIETADGAVNPDDPAYYGPALSPAARKDIKTMLGEVFGTKHSFAIPKLHLPSLQKTQP